MSLNSETNQDTGSPCTIQRSTQYPAAAFTPQQTRRSRTHMFSTQEGTTGSMLPECDLSSSCRHDSRAPTCFPTQQETTGSMLQLPPRVRSIVVLLALSSRSHMFSDSRRNDWKHAATASQSAIYRRPVGTFIAHPHVFRLKKKGTTGSMLQLPPRVRSIVVLSALSSRTHVFSDLRGNDWKHAATASQSAIFRRPVGTIIAHPHVFRLKRERLEACCNCRVVLSALSSRTHVFSDSIGNDWNHAATASQSAIYRRPVGTRRPGWPPARRRTHPSSTLSEARGRSSGTPAQAATLAARRRGR